MRLRGLFVALAGLVLAGCSVIPGQQVDVDGGESGAGRYTVMPIDGQLVERLAEQRSREEDAGAGVAAAEDYDYRVGPGDVLSIVVWNHPELTNPFGDAVDSASSGRLVRPDGTLFFPYVGPIDAAGLTLEDIQERLARGLESYVQQPQVNVRVREYRSKQVYVTGEVREPGMLPITDRPLTVLDAISRAGGFQQHSPNQNPYGANARRALLTRDGETRVINLRSLYRTGDGNRVLRDGDILHVPDDSDNKVFVLGEVVNQTSVRMHNGELTLAEAVAGAEGINLSTANTEQIYVIRGQPVEGEDGLRIDPRIYRLDASDATALLMADAFPMRPRDVVFVSTAEVVRWNRVIEQIAPTIRSAYQIELLNRGVSD
ncbi:polysaccharide biosynthesis/export family protein [Halofilum ochraceum]|uniref:polysaccharide biosynthesis/export family protein n=1 Tax=Halofilum ochraceum TaxID=1611323 RepID=UPI0008DACF3B|nr:polysaccharide biosynthesis/export family protein [Halofilum ochraceum]